MPRVATLLGSLLIRDICRSIQTQAGDGCWSLAQECGISQDELNNFNPSPFSCNTIEVGDHVCCSAGALPDLSPQKQPDGSCANYTIQSGDTCSSIGTANQIKDWHKIEAFNSQTWGWAGCSQIETGQAICLSDGSPPFPAEMSGAVCGPQVPGTRQPADMSPADWAKLNPCPLNACCNVWGQCGISDDFCTASAADTGVPGTSKNGPNGCISNCGTGITNNNEKPEAIKRIGYFEAWTANTSCLSIDLTQIDTTYYTHVHFAFGNITSDWRPDIGGFQQEFGIFKQLDGIKKVLSLGGWAFSTDPATYNIFRTGVQAANRQVFARNVADFIKQNGLDGVDIDWEYPGAQDIPGIPADSLTSGSDYLEFLKLVKAQLDPTQTLSIAAPASYWYLQGFPIANISDVVDYIVYMTYDLHGQWDYGNKFVDPGCPGGNCLRHQVNETEIGYALAMITKAGAPARKVLVGMAMYGRSFEMTDPDCAFPNCTYTGPDSGAAAGRCTKTAGYLSNSEIFEIIDAANSKGAKIQEFYDQGDILVYNDTQWVSYLTPSSCEGRRAYTDALNFGGTSDWAIDLNITDSDSAIDEDFDNQYAPSDYDVCNYTITYAASLDVLAEEAPYIRKDCLDATTLQVLMDILELAYLNFTLVNKDYDEMFGYYEKYMKNLVPKTAAQAFMFNASAARPNTTPLPPILGQGMRYFDCKLSNGATIPCSDFDDSKYLEPETKGTTALVLKDHDGYVGALSNFGLDPDWVALGDYKFSVNIHESAGRGGSVSYSKTFKFSNFPVENNSMIVPNPKDIITKGLGSISDLQTSMAATYMDVMIGMWVGGSASDAVQVYSTPIFILLQAIDSMKQAKDLGKKEQQNEEEEQKRKKDFILLIVSVVLMFVPVIGEELALATGFASLARAIAIAGELGNASIGIYDTVSDPKSAIVKILGMLLGAGAITRATRDGTGIGDIARLRRGTKPDDISAMGRIFKSNDDMLQRIGKMCKRS